MRANVAIIVVVLVVSLSVLFLGFSWKQSQAVAISDSWVIVSNMADQYDSYSSQLLADEFDNIIWDIADEHDYDKFGQSLLLVGGSEMLSKEAPWLHDLSIVKPHDQPDAGFSCSSYVTWDCELLSPKFVYQCDIGDNNYGIITVGYDVTLMRHIISAVGYDHWCTQLGVRLLLDPPTGGQNPLDYKYTIYRLIEHPTEFEAESADGWVYEIVEQG